MKTSIKIKKLWYADVASDGGIGTNWKEIQVSLREATVKFNGSAANVTNYKNVLGSILESNRLKGDKTLVFQLADLSPAVIADFTSGTVTTTADSVKYACPENENGAIEKSIKFLTESDLLITLPRVSFDAYPMFNDDDLHYYQMDGVVLLPEKAGITSYYEEQLLLPDANDILSFVLAAQTGAATINSSAHTVAITVAALTVVTALVPVIGISVGASILPESGTAKDFTSPVAYVVESASGIKQTWTVTVTVAT